MRWIGVSALLVICGSALAQPNKYADKIKLLEQQGLPYFYNDDLTANIDAWLANQNNVSARIAGVFESIKPVLDYASRTNGLPWFVNFIPAANTGLDNLYQGDGGAGMWPLNFTIGKKYSLLQNSYVDDRLAPDKSSEAACKYIADLFTIYKDWLKVITAFRITPIRLNQVIRLAGNSLDFRDIYEKLTPKEREPVLQFYAAAIMLTYKDEFGIVPLSMPEMKADTVSTDEAMSFLFIEQYTGITAQALIKLNPELKTSLVPWFGQIAYFKVPEAQKNDYNRMRDSMMKAIRLIRNPPPIMDTIVRVVDSVTYIEIRPRTEKPVSPVITPKPAPSNAKVWVWYSVKAGDGLFTLSDVFDCSMPEMRSWNYIRGNMIHAGQSLKFYVPSAKLNEYKRINAMSAAQKRAVAARD